MHRSPSKRIVRQLYDVNAELDMIHQLAQRITDMTSLPDTVTSSSDMIGQELRKSHDLLALELEEDAFDGRKPGDVKIIALQPQTPPVS